MSAEISVTLPDLKDYPVLYEVDFLDYPLLCQGHVRDVFDLGEYALMVATDRISVSGRTMATPIPFKGHVLTAMCEFWFDQTRHIMDNHYVTSDLDEIGRVGFDLSAHADRLRGRTMLVKKAEVLPVACVVRGYLYGSGWREYQKGTAVSGIGMRRRLRLGSRFPKPIVSPATQKPEGGRVENITYERMGQIVGANRAEAMQEASLQMFKFAETHVLGRGIILADTKLEFGLVDDKLLIVDELLTPDSSRLWPKDAYTPGKHQLAFDKQFVRDYLDAAGWDPSKPAPPLPEKVATKCSEKYFAAYQQILGQDTL
jgi:phosphoribosylaminoimidazole-succinocarboxamide synthase